MTASNSQERKLEDNAPTGDVSMPTGVSREADNVSMPTGVSREADNEKLQQKVQYATCTCCNTSGSPIKGVWMSDADVRLLRQQKQCSFLYRGSQERSTNKRRTHQDKVIRCQVLKLKY